jgi:hypothetical protein
VHRTDALYEGRKENPSQLRIYFLPILGIYGRTQLIHIFSALIEKKNKFSSYIRKRNGAVAKSYMTKGLLIYD